MPRLPQKKFSAALNYSVLPQAAKHAAREPLRRSRMALAVIPSPASSVLLPGS
jgi:hypothetical protein